MNDKTPPGGFRRSPTQVQNHFERKTRWRYERDGREFGPFSADDMRRRIGMGDVHGDTRVFEEWQRQWFRLGDIAQFASALSRFQKEEEARNLLVQSKRAERKVKRAQRSKGVMANGFLLAAIGGASLAGWLIYNTVSGDPSGVEEKLFHAMDITALPTWVEPAPESIPPVQIIEPRSKVEKRPRATRSGGGGGTAPKAGPWSIDELVSIGGGGAVISASSGGAAEDLRFDQEEGAGGSADIDGFMRQVSGPVGGCVRKEVEARPGFRGATLAVTLSPSGAPTGVRLKGAGEVSRSLIQCLRRATTKARIASFSGAPKHVDIPLTVRGQ